MNNPECKYLFDILENTFENAQPGCLKDDCRVELLNAVEGIDRLFSEQKERLGEMERVLERGMVKDRITL